MKRVTVALIITVLLGCAKKTTGPGDQGGDGTGGGGNTTAVDTLVPVPVYFRNVNDNPALADMPYADSFRIYVNYFVYAGWPGFDIDSTGNSVVIYAVYDTVFAARVDAPGLPDAGYLEYHATTSRDTTWQYIGTIWLLHRRSFYGGHNNPLFQPCQMVYYPGAEEPVLQFDTPWDSTLLNQGRAFNLGFSYNEPIYSGIPYHYTGIPDGTCGWIALDDSTFKEIKDSFTAKGIGGYLEDPPAVSTLKLRIELDRWTAYELWQKRDLPDPYELSLRSYFEY